MDIQPIKDLLTKASDVYVLFPSVADQGTIASAIGLYQALLTTGKNVRIATPNPIDTNNLSLANLDAITQDVGNTNLVISLKVKGRESIDKVSYNLDEAGKVFNLIIQPQKGQAPIDSKDVKYSYSGARADLVFIVGANRLEDLGAFHQDEPQLFTKSPTVAVNHMSSTKYAQYHIEDRTLSSLAEVTGLLIKNLGFEYDQNMATSLLFGIDTATNKLSTANVQASTFELVAGLMKAGGVRNIQQAPAPTRSTTPAAPTQATPQTQPQTATQNNQVPKDWLAPKIYKSTPKV